MKLKLRFIIFLLLFGHLAKANMASPIWEGTLSSSAISSKDITILSERIFIKIDSNFKTAKFIVEYNIQSDRSGRQIPLLFYAQNFKDSFYVWLDNKKINIRNVPIANHENSSFDGFAKYFEEKNYMDEITIYWQENAGYVYRLSDLKYFEADIEKGIHRVRVEYTANVWTDVSDWIKKFSFRYSLTPAKYWKSFGSLEITVEQDRQVRDITSNLGLPNEKTIKLINTWTFKKLPAEYFEISFTPAANNFAKALIAIDPFGLSLIATILLVIVHLYVTIRYRQNNLEKKYSSVVVLGSILIPFFSLWVYVYSYVLIYNALGKDAGRHGGYVFLSFIFYPLILIIYWLTFWFVDRLYKRYLLNKAASNTSTAASGADTSHHQQ